MDAKQKEAAWLGSSKEVLRSFPKPVRRKLGHAVWEAQLGRFPHGAKPLHGFGGASVVEILADHDGNAYRAVYTVRFADFVYVLHVFQKKSKKGVKTPANVVELIRKRLKIAEDDYEKWKAKRQNENQG
jgi:phage-related protein